MQHSQHSLDDGPRARLAVVVREGLKGHHLLFDTRDIEAAARAERTVPGALESGDSAAAGPQVGVEVAREVARVGLALARAATLDDARALVSASSTGCRSELARLYLSFLGRCAAGYSATGDAGQPGSSAPGHAN